MAIGVEDDDSELAAVAGVDQPGRVDECDTVAHGQARSRLDEAGMALGNRHGQAGSHRRPLARRQLDELAGGEIETGVAGIGARRNNCVGP